MLGLLLMLLVAAIIGFAGEALVVLLFGLVARAMHRVP